LAVRVNKGKWLHSNNRM